MPWPRRLSADARKLHQRNRELANQLLHTQEELQISERRRTGLEVILSARLNRITELNGRIDALREQNRRLDAEADRLAEMVRFMPPVDATTPVPK